MKTIFITGGTGYVGSRLIPALQREGFRIKALVRPGSQTKLRSGCEQVIGNALDSSTYSKQVSGADIFIHLVGVAHPSPRKKEQFLSVDLKSTQQAVKAAKENATAQFIYMSVAQTPASIMADYQAARAAGEQFISSNLANYTFVRPWYIVGPGHYWPLILWPLYFIARLIPSTREKAIKLSLVTLPQIVKAFVYVAKNPAPGKRLIEIADIKAGSNF